MSEFEDNLWLEVVREHGNELARAGRPVRRNRRAMRPSLLAGTTAGVAVTATAAALLLGASTSPPAFAVTRNHDGTVTVSLKQLTGIAGANEKLTAMGVRAQIEAEGKTPPKLLCPGGTAPTITFDPARIAKRHVLVITPRDTAPLKGHSTGSGNTGVSATSGAGNQVVRTMAGGGEPRTSPEPANQVVQMSCP